MQSLYTLSVGNVILKWSDVSEHSSSGPSLCVIVPNPRVVWSDGTSHDLQITSISQINFLSNSSSLITLTRNRNMLVICITTKL